MKFIVDKMVGRLARWLRLLGYDTKYENTLDNYGMLFTALVEHRMLLTKNSSLAESGGSAVYLIRAIGWRAQLREVINQFGLSKKLRLTRCPICNDKIVPVEKNSIVKLVPPYTFKTHEQFWKCKKCGQIYWEGTHISMAENELEKLFL